MTLPIRKAVHDVLAHHWALVRNRITNASVIDQSAIIAHTMKVVGHCLIKRRCRASARSMVVDHVKDDSNLIGVQFLNHALDVAYGLQRIAGIACVV